MIKKLLLVICCLSSFDPAQAQHPLVLQKFQEWNEAAPAPPTEKFKEEVRSTAREVYGRSDACDNSAIIIDRIQPATADRFVFSAILRQQLRNAWTVTARVPGCDTVPVRYMVMQNMDKSLKTIRVNRGKSYAHDSLISDALLSVRLAATSALKREDANCEDDGDLKLGITRVESEEEGLGADLFGVRYSGSWSETWPVETCGRTVEVLVNFTADGDGGAYFDVPSDKIIVSPR